MGTQIFINLLYPLYLSVPPPKFFAYINPVQIHLDPLTLLWLNAFSLNLQQSVKSLTLEKTEPPYLDVKVEAIMFRVRMLSLHHFESKTMIHETPCTLLS